MAEWIACSDRMPPIDGGHTEYLVCVKHANPEYKFPIVTIAEWETRDTEIGPYWSGVDVNHDHWTYVSHWMKIPDAPEV